MRAALIGAAVLAAVVMSAETTIAEQSGKGVLVIRNGRVVPMAGPEIENGVVLIEGGKIKAVGAAADVPIPDGAEIVDAAGGWILPGLVESNAAIGLREMYGPPGGDELSDPVTAGLRILDALNPFDKRFEQTARAGITTLMIAPGRANVIGARTAVVKPRGKTAEDMVLLEPAGIKFSLGEGPKDAFGGKGRLPSTRMGSAYVVRKTLLEAAEYGRKRKEHAEKAAAAAKGWKSDAAPAPLTRNLDLEPLADLLEGKLQAFIECHRADDIRTALRLIDEFGFRAVLVGAAEGYRLAGEIAERGLPVVVGPMGVGSKRIETMNVKIENAALLAEAGVKVALSAEDASGIGTQEELALAAALAVKGGLDRDAALRAVTLSAAEILGVADRVGSLEPGKDADIVIFTGDPFHYLTRVSRVFIDGHLVPAQTAGSVR
ncbi:MAG: amidohydrolase family protein [Acidobacteriota bacterium]|nr:amidohydrolase family protein [Acidobacteriota bacterium]